MNKQISRSYSDKSAALIGEQIQNGLNSFYEDLLLTQESTDPRSISDRFAIKISQSIYFEEGNVVVFRAGPKITNIQYSELLSLIPVHSTTLSDQDAPPSIQFHTTTELRGSLENLWNSIVPDRESMAKLKESKQEFKIFSETIQNAFAPLAACTIIVDFFSCSAAIFVPPTLKTDFETIVRHAGYVHSYGKLIYVRNTEKSSIDEFRENIARFLRSRDDFTRGMTVPFVFYAHEIFDGEESETEKADISLGLGELKFYAEKYFFGGRPVYSFRDALESDASISEHVKFITSERPYLSQLREIDNRYPGTIWFFRDHKLFGEEETYFLCYHQVIINDDLFIKFDEDKPGWIAPVTLPHSLASAMLSLARPYFALESSITVVDPFVGTGTTYFESEKKFVKPRFFGGDLCLASDQVIKDNGEILLSPEKYLESAICPLTDLISGEDAEVRFISRFGSILSKTQDRWARNRKFHDSEWAEEALHQAVQISDKVIASELTDISDPHVNVRRLREYDFGPQLEAPIFRNLRERLLFYCYWKVVSKNAPAFLEGRADVTSKLFKEVSMLVAHLESLCVRGIPENTFHPSVFATPVQADYNDVDVHSVGGRFTALTGKDKGELSQFAGFLDENLGESGADIIIMDPPYGFNTDNAGALELLDLYERIIRQIVACSGEQTHLLMCLPEKSHNGQILPSFVTKAWFLPMLLNEAALQGVDVVNTAKIWPGSNGFLRAPYYWKSEKALTRSILHVILKRD